MFDRLLNVRPRTPLPDGQDGFPIDAEPVRDGSGALAGGPDLSHVIVRELRSSVSLAGARDKPSGVRMQQVAARGGPLQVASSIVSLVAVLVVDLHPVRVAVKGTRHEASYEDSFLDPSAAQVNREVSVSVLFLCEDSSTRGSSNAPRVADFVVPGPANCGQPLLHGRYHIESRGD